jgi:hypothetical protein
MAGKKNPTPTDFDVRLVHMPPAAERALAPIELPQQGRGMVDDPAMDGRVIDRDSALGQLLLEVAYIEAMGEIPPHTAGSPNDQNAP